MESHLRDAVDQLRTAGLTDEEAFLVATRRVGSAQALEAEFAKINGRSVWLDRLLWMLVGVQAWVLIGLVANVFRWLFGWLVFGYFQGSGWLPRVTDLGIEPVSILLWIVFNLLAIGAIAALCWRHVRRIGPRLPELLRQPGWLTRRLVALCMAIFLASVLSVLSQAVAARWMDARTFGNLALSFTMAGAVLFVVKTATVTWLGVVLIRRRLKLAAS
jgi:hypothetical protein